MNQRFGDYRLVYQGKPFSHRPTLNKKFALLRQVHSNHTVRLHEHSTPHEGFWATADAVVTKTKSHVVAIRTADCIPILFWHPQRIFFGAVHAGWRGLKEKIFESALQTSVRHYNISVTKLRFWIGPHITTDSYQVGKDVYKHFSDKFALPSRVKDKRQLNLTGLMCSQMIECGIRLRQIELCAKNTYTTNNLYSHRQGDKGRNLASLHFEG